MNTYCVDGKHAMCFYCCMNNLRRYREHQGLTQSDLGNRISPRLRQSAVSNHEVGLRTPDVYQAIQYAQALNASVEEVFPLPVGESNSGMASTASS